jgi:hypothetical protein
MRSRGKLVALLAVFVAVGLVTGTGAFSTVEAQRTADVNVAGDSSALLGLQAGNSDLIQVDNDQVAIKLSSSSNAAGVNKNATTTVDQSQFLNVTNNGAQNTVEINLQYNTSDNVDVYFVVNGSDVDDDSSGSLDAVGNVQTSLIDTTKKYPIQNNTVELTPGEKVSVGIVIDVGDVGSGTELITDDVTITAEAK